uniref:OSJNBa0011E07.9 protein n=1 Tax=Oryza sativa subsp. japonica TaxID=39947 RepID=Q7FA99_ORYSJ|nr:OSJNBa0011E07.9 [Oryza sativa Japonica Group]
MADRDDEQILLDTIAEGSSQYSVDDEGNEDPNQYLNEEGNNEGNQEANQKGTEEGTDSQPSAGQKRPRGKRGPAKKLEGRHIDAFVAYKTGAQGQAQIEKNKANAAKKKYHHRLGSGGYGKAIPKWDKLEADLIARGIEPATANWPERSRNWFYAHGGSLNPEDIHTYRSWMRSKRDTEAKIVDLEYRVSTYEARMQEEVTRQVDQCLAEQRGMETQAPVMVVSGMAIPTDPWSTYHCRPIPHGYAKVEIELVERTYEVLELDIPGGDGEKKLGDTAHAIILWRVEIELVERTYEDLVFPGQEWPPTPPSPPQAQSPPPSPRQSPLAPSPAPPPPPRAPAAKSAPSGPRATTPPRAPATKSTPSRSRPYEPTPSRPKKKARSDEPRLPTLKKRAYNLTPEELDEAVRAEVREQLKPRSPEKKIPIAPEVRDHFIKMAEPGKPVEVSDYDRSLRKALKAKPSAVKCGKEVPQLGQQPRQEVEPLVVEPAQLEICNFLKDTGLSMEQLLEDAPIETAPVMYTFKLGEPLVTPDKIREVPTQMYRFHQWYMDKSAMGREMFGARVRNSDYYQGEHVIWIRYKEVFDLYHLKALDVSILSAWTL